MEKEVPEYVAACPVCTRSKIFCRPPSGLLDLCLCLIDPGPSTDWLIGKNRKIPSGPLVVGPQEQ